MRTAETLHYYQYQVNILTVLLIQMKDSADAQLRDQQTGFRTWSIHASIKLRHSGSLLSGQLNGTHHCTWDDTWLCGWEKLIEHSSTLWSIRDDWHGHTEFVQRNTLRSACRAADSCIPSEAWRQTRLLTLLLSLHSGGWRLHLRRSTEYNRELRCS